MFGRETAAKAEISSSGLLSLQTMRPPARLHSQIRAVPDLFPGACQFGHDSGRIEIKLVSPVRDSNYVLYLCTAK